MAKPPQSSESTLNAPPPPRDYKHAAAILHRTPSLMAPMEPPEPAANERRVEGAWRWTGTEYRWIPSHNEQDPPPYVWKRHKTDLD